jgi:hypothetical protein
MIKKIITVVIALLISSPVFGADGFDFSKINYNNKFVERDENGNAVRTNKIKLVLNQAGTQDSDDNLLQLKISDPEQIQLDDNNQILRKVVYSLVFRTTTIKRQSKEEYLAIGQLMLTRSGTEYADRDRPIRPIYKMRTISREYEIPIIVKRLNDSDPYLKFTLKFDEEILANLDEASLIPGGIDGEFLKAGKSLLEKQIIVETSKGPSGRSWRY